MNDCLDPPFAERSDDRWFSYFPELPRIDEAYRSGELQAALTLCKQGLTNHRDSALFYLRAADIYDALGDLASGERILLDGLTSSLSVCGLCGKLADRAMRSARSRDALCWWVRGCVVQLKAGILVDGKPFLSLAYVAQQLGLSAAQGWLLDRADRATVGGPIRFNDIGAEQRYRIARDLMDSEGDDPRELIERLCATGPEVEDGGTAPESPLAQALLTDPEKQLRTRLDGISDERALQIAARISRKLAALMDTAGLKLSAPHRRAVAELLEAIDCAAAGVRSELGPDEQYHLVATVFHVCRAEAAWAVHRGVLSPTAEASLAAIGWAGVAAMGSGREAMFESLRAAISAVPTAEVANDVARAFDSRSAGSTAGVAAAVSERPYRSIAGSGAPTPYPDGNPAITGTPEESRTGMLEELDELPRLPRWTMVALAVRYLLRAKSLLGADWPESDFAPVLTHLQSCAAAGKLSVLADLRSITDRIAALKRTAAGDVGTAATMCIEAVKMPLLPPNGYPGLLSFMSSWLEEIARKRQRDSAALHKQARAEVLHAYRIAAEQHWRDDTPAAFETPGPGTSTTSQSGATEAKRSCFIATACYGDPDHPDVIALRRWRDERLGRSIWGRAFTRGYEAVSPNLARWVSRKPALNRWIRRWLISPLARAVSRGPRQVKHKS